MPTPAQQIARITVDDKTYDLDFSDITAIDAKDFRREVGIPLLSVLSDRQEADLDVVAGLVWLARRKTESGITYEEVAKSISLGSTLGVTKGTEVEADPET